VGRKSLLIIGIILVIAVIGIGALMHPPEGMGPPPENPPEETVPWIFEDPRLNRTAQISLPIKLEDLPKDPHIGGITTWGFHGGNHPEGFDHTGFAAEKEIPVYAPDDGVVAYVEEDHEENEFKVVIFHNYTIASWFDHLSKFFANEHDAVEKGQLIGYTKSYMTFSTFDWALIDFNNDTGPLFTLYCEYKNGSFVPPFGYLNETELEAVLQYFNTTMLQPFLNGEVVPGMNKAEHNLVNPVFLKPIDENDISGVWVYQGYWEKGGYPELLVFIHKNTTYFGEVYHAVYADWAGPVKFDAWEANYTINTSVTPHRIKITFDYTGPNPPPTEIGPIYGIFELSTYENRLMLKIEFSNDTYPSTFTENAAIYLNRTRNHPLEEAKFREVSLFNMQEYNSKNTLKSVKMSLLPTFEQDCDIILATNDLSPLGLCFSKYLQKY